jgi:hypothetical protein
MASKAETESPAWRTYSFGLLGDDRYLAVEVGGHKVLLDTGSNASYRVPGGPGVLNILDQQVQLMRMPVTPSHLEEGFELLEFRFDALLGMDVLGKLAWRIDRDEGTAEASAGFVEEDATVWIPMDSAYRPPTITTGDGADAIFDTGSKVSYRIGPAPENSEEIGESLAWGLLFGKFKTTLRSGSVELGGWEVPVRFGTLPPEVDRVMLWMETRWVLGNDVLRHFRVTLDFPNGRLGLRPLRSSLAVPVGKDVDHG